MRIHGKRNFDGMIRQPFISSLLKAYMHTHKCTVISICRYNIHTKMIDTSIQHTVNTQNT